MSNIVIQASYTIQSGENIYILTIDDKGNPDLLYAGGSLKAKRLAKDTAVDLIKEFGCKNRSKPDNDARVRPDAKTEFNRTVKRCSTGH